MTVPEYKVIMASTAETATSALNAAAAEGFEVQSMSTHAVTPMQADASLGIKQVGDRICILMVKRSSGDYAGR